MNFLLASGHRQLQEEDAQGGARRRAPSARPAARLDRVGICGVTWAVAVELDGRNHTASSPDLRSSSFVLRPPLPFSFIANRATLCAIGQSSRRINVFKG